MPFTISHTAIIYPLQKLRLKPSLTAVAAGAMLPDFENFLQMRHVRGIGHHWIGIPLLDLPAGIFLCLIFHNLLKYPGFQLLPRNLQRRLVPWLRTDWNQYLRQHPLAVVGWLIIGAATHLLWDGFTHSDGMFIPYLPFLRYRVHLAGIYLPVHLLLQILTSVLGLWLVTAMIFRLPKRTDILLPSDLDKKAYIQALILAFIVVLGGRIWLLPQSNTYLSLVKGSLGAMMYAWILASLLVRTGEESTAPPYRQA